jgi:hypothetical protein
MDSRTFDGGTVGFDALVGPNKHIRGYMKMTEYFEIRATYDKNTITVYQAYNESIAVLAARQNKFVAPFSFNRMTWIKPSFLWMMERSNWGQKSNQECTLAIKIKRESFEYALRNGILTSPEKSVYPDAAEWERAFKNSKIHIQWDPERDIGGKKLAYRSIQIGVSRHFIHMFNDEWISEIEDISPLVKKLRTLFIDGKKERAKQFLPAEKVYPLPDEIRKVLGMKENDK